MGFAESGKRAISVICEKSPFAITLHISPFRLNVTFVFLNVHFNTANTSCLCPEFFCFDVLDLSECRSEEVMFSIFQAGPRGVLACRCDMLKFWCDILKKMRHAMRHAKN